jgi:hypothetical protein
MKLKPIILPFQASWFISLGLLPTAIKADEILAHPNAAEFRTWNAPQKLIHEL